jgi:hypothetical protein
VDEDDAWAYVIQAEAWFGFIEPPEGQAWDLEIDDLFERPVIDVN